MGDGSWEMWAFQTKVLKFWIALILFNIFIFISFVKKKDSEKRVRIFTFLLFFFTICSVLIHLIKPYRLIYLGFGDSTIVNNPFKYLSLFQGVLCYVFIFYLNFKQKETSKTGIRALIFTPIILIICYVYLWGQNPDNLPEKKYDILYDQMGGHG